MTERDERLRDTAANRGCRLVRSRRRKPGGDFGRYGLKDAATGKEILGFSGDGLTATAEEIEDFLRGGAAASWKGSLGESASTKPTARSKKKEPAPSPRPARRAEKSTVEKARAPARKAETPKKAPKPPPEPKVREARPKDAEAITSLVQSLGYDVDAPAMRKRMAQLAKAGEPTLVIEREGLAGCLTWHVTPVLHRDRPVGRITMLVIAEEARGEGLGTLLVAAAQERLAEAGCGLVEVTSHVKRMRAHAFYEGQGFERSSYRFYKPLDRD